MKNIAFIMSSMGRGGAERVVSILSREYCNMGWDIDICMLLHNINDYELDNRVHVLDFSHEGEAKTLRTAKMLISLRQYIRSSRPQIVVPFLAKTSALFYLATFGSAGKDYRIVASERIDPYSVHYSKPLRVLVNRAYKNADAVVFQTKKAQSYYSKSIQHKSVIIGNPVSTELKQQDSGQHIIVSAGRLEPQKNQKMLISAFSMIAEKHPDYQLHIYGSGRLQNELGQQIDACQMSSRIILKGNSANYLEYLAQAELFVLSSDYEGLSNALLEAMMMGLPVISTNCAGSDEVIDDGKNGLLVPVGDTKALAEAMERLITDREFASTLGLAAGKSAQRFKTSNVIGQWEKVIEG